MTPAPPQTPPPDVAAHAASVVDFAIKVATVLGASWVGVSRIAKPYVQWRRHHHRELTVEVLTPELTQLKELNGLRELCERILEGQEKILARQEQTFEELNVVHNVAHQNSERHDEMNEFLDAIGFSSDRRRFENDERRKAVDKLLAELRARKLARDRFEDSPDVDLTIPPRDWPE